MRVLMSFLRQYWLIFKLDADEVMALDIDVSRPLNKMWTLV